MDFELFDDPLLEVKPAANQEKEETKVNKDPDASGIVIDPFEFLDINPEDTEEKETKETEVEIKKEEEVKEEEEREELSKEEILEKVNALKELGYLHLPEDYEVEDLDKAVKDSKEYRGKEAFDSVFEAVPDVEIPGVGNAKELFQYLVEKGGSNIDDFKKFYANSFNPESYDLSEEKDQKEILTLLYKEKGFTDEKISKLIQRAEDALELEDDAEKAFEELKVLDKVKKENHEKELKAEEAKRIEFAEKQYKELETIVNTADEFAGFDVGPKEKSKALASLYQTHNINGEKVTDFNYKLYGVVLQNPDLTLALSAILNTLKQDPKTKKTTFDFSKYTVKEKTKAVKSVRDTIDKITSESKFNSTREEKSTKKGFDWNAVL